MLVRKYLQSDMLVRKSSISAENIFSLIYLSEIAFLQKIYFPVFITE